MFTVVQAASCELLLSILSKTLQDRYYYYGYFTEEETKLFDPKD